MNPYTSPNGWTCPLPSSTLGGGVGITNSKVRGRCQTADWHQIWYTCADSSGNGYTPNKLPQETQGGTWRGFRGSNIQNSREAVKRLDRLAPTLVHVGGFIWEYKYNSPLNTPGGMAGGGGVRGSQIQKSWEAVKRLDRLAPNLVHVCGFILGMDIG